MVVLLLAVQMMASSPISGTVRSCHDGDTCRVVIADRERKIRLGGVDAPELDQPGGRESQQFMAAKIVGRDVELICEGRSYDRKTCRILLEGTDVGEDLVRAGHAWDSPKYSKGRYREAQEEARREGRGFWAREGGLISPYCHRWSKRAVCKKDPTHMP